MIHVNHVSKSFDKMVLDDLDFEIKDGSIFGLIGINGAGKSTLLNILSGVMKSDKGYVLYDGYDVYENEDIKKDIFYLPDEPYYERNTTPESLIQIYKVFYNLNVQEYYSYLEKFNIPKDKTMYNFSKGMKRQVFVSLALAIKPKYLFLDEAFDGLDPLARMSLKKALINVQEEKEMTVVISSHSLRELEDICDSYGLIDKMKIASYGDIQDSFVKYHKYTMAFNEIYDAKDFSDIEFLTFDREKRVITCVTRLDLDSMEEKIKDKEPLILEEMNIDFEEMFMIEVQSRGYLK